MSDWLKDLAKGTDGISRAVQVVLALMTGIGTFLTSVKEDPVIFFLAALGLVLVGIWATWSWILIRIRPRPTDLKPALVEASTYLRGLLPFRSGGQILGRDTEFRQVTTILNDESYIIGYLSGDAGSGKTSLLRAQVATHFEEIGHEVVMVERTGGDPVRSLLAELPPNEEQTNPSAAPEKECLDFLLRYEELSEKKCLVIFDQFEEFFCCVKRMRAEKKFHLSFKICEQ